MLGFLSFPVGVLIVEECKGRDFLFSGRFLMKWSCWLKYLL